MTDLPDIQNEQRERGRLRAQGRSTDDGSTWAFRGLGAPGVKLFEADTVALTESILRRTR